MSIDKKIKAEVLKVYDTWLYSYLNGDVATYNSYLDDTFHFIGSTGNEEFLNRNDTANFFEATAEQLSGKSQVRNETKVVQQFNELVFITHLFDAWFLAGDDWAFYSRFRFTNALQKKKEGWKFIYQHYSTPDTKAQDGETIGYDQVSAENLQLREAIQRRTKELEDKNRELEIEGALQRIRAEAVAMKESSDLLDIVVTMRTEFTKLGHEAHYFWHMMWHEETYEKAMTSGDGTKIGFVMELPRHIHGDIPLLAKWEKSKNPMVVYAMNAEEAIAYVDKMVALGDFKNIDPQAPSHEDIRHIKGLTFIIARTTHGEIGYSLPGKVEHPPEKDLKNLEKFARAFDLAHQRFLDLQKAEKQAREVQIELALEKVRSRTMAMQHSDELAEASFLLDKQVRRLGVKTWGCAFNIYGENESTEWFGNEAGVLHTYTVPRKGIFKEYYEKGQKGESLIIKEFTGEDCIAHYNYMSQLPVIGDVLKTLKEKNNGFPTYQIDHVVYFKYGYLLFITREFVPEAHDIFKRFAKVFEQTYTRFLDLQKAEAQARESEIELALERVRARTMAMQKSEELKEVIQVVYDQFVKLNIHTEHTGFILDYKERDDMHIWLADKNKIQSEIFLPYFDCAHWNSFREAKKKGGNFFSNQLSLKEKNKFYKNLFKLIPDVPEGVLETYMDYPGLAISTVLLDNIGLYIENFDGIPYSEEENEILMRFGKVFQQTYTRFLDLQKAEAQAREAQIETALEKVRSRSMAMQQSYEIGDVAKVLYDQLTGLGGALWGTGFGFCEEKAAVDEYWFVNEKGVMPPLKIPHTKDTTHKAMYKGWQDNLEILTIAKDGTELEDHYNYMLSVPDVKPIFQGMLDSGITFPTWQKWHAAYFKFGYLLVITTEPYEDEEIFKRFSKVFEQSYTRFLDLQKAEAQVRKSQIETSLERVRSRGMAMHTSDELREVGDILFEEITKLGIESISSGYVLFDADENIGWNYAPNPSTGKIMSVATGVYHKETEIMRSVLKNWKQQKPLYLVEMDNKQTITHQTFIAETSINFPLSAKELIAVSPTELKLHCFNFEQGYLMNIGGTKLTEDQSEIMLRFTKVFQQTYTRFLDLQKAEEQAREAQIEASLEKVRSVALSLQKSEDMLDIAQVLYEQLLALGFTEIRNAIIDIHNDDETFLDYDYSHDMSSAVTKFSFYGDPVIEEQIRITESSSDAFFEIELKGEQLEELIETRLRNGEKEDPRLREIEHLTYNLYSFGNGAIGISNFGILSDAQKIILKRFRNVFTFAYKRYTDLANAEAQAREAKIEASLEKVRSVALSMQKTDDMLDIAQVLYEQLVALGFTDIRNSIIDLHNDDNVTFWDYDYSEEMSGTITLMRYDDDPIIEKQLKAIVSSTDAFFELVLEGQELQDLIDMRIKNGEAEDPRLREIDQLTYNLYSFGNGAIGISNFGILSEDEKTLLKRFRNVFTFAYKRYTDLAKAEAQTRETHIEMALEKVRSRSLAMQIPEELQEVVAVVAEKLKDLGVIFDAGGVILCTYFPDNKDVVHWIAVDDFSTSGRYLVPYFDNPIFSEAWDSKIRGDAYFSKEFSLEAKNHFFEYAFEHSDYKHFPEDYKQYVLQAENHRLSAAWSKNSAILIPSLTGTVPSESDAEIMKRFAKVFEQAYIRFMDLQKAEAQARETEIELALERIRARTMAMHKSAELSNVAAVLFEQITLLTETPTRFNIAIANEKEKSFDIWITDQNGQNINKQFVFRAEKSSIITEIFDSWKNNKKHLILDLSGKKLEQWLRYTSTEVGIPFDISKIKEHRIITSIFFEHGCVGITTHETPNKTTVKLLERFTKVFEQTYTRFLDLKKAESQAVIAEQNLIKLKTEKQRAEEALSELQQTQKQLIQSEKMASLGELTAGIAHEIQNPLNFVNNFSEVSNELIDEMNEEIEKGDLEEAKLIANDIKQNLEKINHHGKRADAIVKGMLQHSRKSTAEKVPTDINKLADEYLRLAYHGLRAKDKSFNATLETNFDETIGKVQMIPQDMGRVILNLITNAFYATNEKKKWCQDQPLEARQDFKPTVLVSTKKEKEHITILVKDNGNGIPKHVVDKIFQPFFTTKPTGEGTGLGLSMSYDIVTKGHAGELIVETKDGEGTVFIIQLPL